MGQFSLGYRAFDGNEIDLSVIVSALPLGVEIGVGASGDCKDCVVGGETIGLLRSLTYL
jgi:hypothetical protein